MTVSARLPRCLVMTAEHARLARLRRLEKIRAQTKDQAAREAAAAEGTLAQLEALVARTRAMAADYRHALPGDGLALRQIGQFVTGLGGIAATTSGNAAQARQLADRKQHELAAAERRRAAVQERVDDAGRLLARRGEVPALGARPAIGTPLE